MNNPGLKELQDARFTARLKEKDASLWKSEKEHQKIIKNSLGWLTLPDAMAAGLGQVRSFVSEIKKEKFERVVILGMGGSSLACEVFRTCFAAQPGYPLLEILDSTNPGAISDLSDRLDLKRTLFVAASKSGSTIEPNCLLSYFYEKASQAEASGKAGNHFIAITDPGTSMEKLARKLAFRKIFINPPDIGGRYSALSLFGLVPAGLMGVDLERLLEKARACAREEEAAANLGASWGFPARLGRDKLTLSLSPGLASFGLWIEQLVAESTGKEGRGVLPVVESIGESDHYGSDRIFVRMTLKGEQQPEIEKRLSALEKSGHPVLRLELKDPYDLGRQFFLWEAATAAAGFLLGVNPFDQPNVQQAKDQTKTLLSQLHKGALPSESPDFRAGGLPAFADPQLRATLKASPSSHLPLKDALAAHLERLQPGDYCVLLAYMNSNPENRRRLEEIRGHIRKTTTAPVSIAWGPRYLHSTGQLYKGGSPKGLFLEITEPDAAALPIPNEKFSFATLHRAQARGDFSAMLEAGRRILRLDLGPTGSDSLQALLNAIEEWRPLSCRS